MCTIVKDSLKDYGVDRFGGRCHDLLGVCSFRSFGEGRGETEGWGGREVRWRANEMATGTRCDPYVNKMLSGDDYDFHCHSNLTRAVVPYGLT